MYVCVCVQLLKKALDNRKVKYAEFLNILAHRVSILFVDMLAKRHYRGDMNIDIEAETIDMQVSGLCDMMVSSK